MRDARGDRVFYFVNYAFLAIILLIVGYPLIYIISCSLSEPYAVSSGRVWLWPVNITFRGYQTILTNKDVGTGYLNAALYTLTTTCLALIMTMLAAYPLSRRDFKLVKPVMVYFTITMFFGGGMIPTYLLMSNLHLTNTRAVMILPGIFGVYNTIIARTFIQSNIPSDLLEAAQLDGCSDFLYLVRIVVPLSKAVIAVIGLYCIVGNWNAYFNALLYLNNRKLYPLQLFLREILIQNTISGDTLAQAYTNAEDLAARQSVYELLKYSLIIVASVPVMCVYPFVQKYFVKGVMVGSLKG